MPLFPRLFSNTFRFSPLQNQTTVLPKANLHASKRLVRLQTLLNEGANLLDDYQATGGHQLPSAIEFALKKEHASRSHDQGGSMSAMKELIQDSLLNRQAIQFLAVHKMFRTPSTWDGLRDLTRQKSHKTKIQTLENQWMLHAPYSHFSPKGLLDAARCLDKLRFIVDELSREARNYADYPDERKALNACMSYLDKYRKTIREQENYIAEALSARILHALDANDLNAHEPLSHVLNKLQGLVPNEALPQQYKPLKSTLPLASAFDYCLRKGSPFLQNTLKKALSLSQHNPLIMIQQDHQKLLIPQSLAAFIPKRPPFFARFSPGHQLRYEFFKNKQELLFNMAALQKPLTIQTSWELDDKQWLKLENITHDVKTALTQARQRPFSIWFNKETTEFSRRWAILLEEQKKKAIQQKLNYLTELAEKDQPIHWASSYTNHIDDKLKLNQAMNEMDNDISFLDENARVSWRRVKHTLEIRQLPTNPILMLNNAIQKVQAGNILPEDSIQKLTLELQLMNPQNKDTFLNHHNEYSAHLHQSLLQQLIDVEEAVISKKPLPNANLVHQTLRLLSCVDQVAEMTADFSGYYSQLLSTFTHFKKMCEQLTVADMQDNNLIQLTAQLNRLAFSNAAWTEAHQLIRDTQEHQNAILEGRTPRTIEYMTKKDEEIQQKSEALKQRFDKLINNSQQFLNQFNERRAAREKHGFLSSNTTPQTEDTKLTSTFTLNN